MLGLLAFVEEIVPCSTGPGEVTSGAFDSVARVVSCGLHVMSPGVKVDSPPKDGVLCDVSWGDTIGLVR